MDLLQQIRFEYEGETARYQSVLVRGGGKPKARVQLRISSKFWTQIVLDLLSFLCCEFVS